MVRYCGSKITQYGVESSLSQVNIINKAIGSKFILAGCIIWDRRLSEEKVLQNLSVGECCSYLNKSKLESPRRKTVVFLW